MFGDYGDKFAENGFRIGELRVLRLFFARNGIFQRKRNFRSERVRVREVRFSKHKDIVGKKYRHYINYDAIEVPYGDAIPSDYDGAMGVPITFLDKYCPDQFEILGIDGGDMGTSYGVSANLTQEECNALFREHKGFRRGKLCYRNDDGGLEVCYRRIIIRKR